jgi:hypothetical protein
LRTRKRQSKALAAAMMEEEEEDKEEEEEDNNEEEEEEEEDRIRDGPQVVKRRNWSKKPWSNECMHKNAKRFVEMSKYPDWLVMVLLIAVCHSLPYFEYCLLFYCSCK